MVDQWQQTLRPLRKVGKLRGVIEVPAFSAECGSKQCIELVPTNGPVAPLYKEFLNPGQGYQWQPTTEFTVRLWVKFQDLGIGADKHVIGTGDASFGGTEFFSVRILDGYIKCLVLTSGPYFVYGNTAIQLDTWYQITVTLSDSNLYLYINGVLDNVEYGVGTGIVNYAVGPQLYIGTKAIGTTNATCYVSGVDFWTVAWDARRVTEYLNVFPYSPGGVGSVIQCLLREGSGTTIKNLKDGYDFTLDYDGFPLEFVNDFPNRYLFGTSFVAGEFVLDTAVSLSFKYPVSPSNDYNFVLVARKSDGTRYKLWTNSDFIYAGTIYFYHGEVLASGTVLEVWNIDGNETVDLEEVLDILTSILHVITSPTTTTNPIDDSPVIDTTLASTVYPLAFPITFNSQQTYP